MKKITFVRRALMFCWTVSQALCLSATVYYRPDWDGGSGGWGDASRYYENVSPAGEMIFFNPGKASKPQPIDVTINDDDWKTLVSLGVTRLQGKSSDVRVVLDLEEDYEWGGQIYERMTLVKTGKGAFRMTSSSLVSFNGNLVVSNGTFKFDKQYQNLSDGGIPLIEVWSPGVFELPTSISAFWLKGLVGDGSVTCAKSGHQLCFLGSDGEYSFSGNFLTNVALTAGTMSALMENKPKCRQYFTGTGYDFTPAIRSFVGTIGASKFGVRGEPSSLGSGTVDTSRRLQIHQAGFRHSEHTFVNVATEPQTTDRTIRFMNDASTNGVVLTLDGGAYGALNWAGTIENPLALDENSRSIPLRYWKDHVNPIYLTGVNSGGACVLSGAVTEAISTNHLFFTKRGSGTWRFAHHATRQFKTPIAIERGTLEYESIAAAGTSCSLGLATVLSTNWTGFASEYIPYAVLLGDGSAATVPDLATFRYVGSEDAACSTRPIGVVGAGRLLDDNAGASVHLAGVSAATPEATLVLDGTRTDSRLDNVTDGEGVLSLEKRGTGTWSLDGDIAYAGTTKVKAGTLALKIAPADYKWYRFTFKDTYGLDTSGVEKSDNIKFFVLRIALFDDAGNDQASGLEYNSSADGNIALLQPGQCAYGYQDTVGERDLGLVFSEEKTAVGIYRTAKPTVSSENPDSWVSVVIRLPESAQPVSGYDMVPGWYTNSNVPDYRAVTDWELEGSVDGVIWDSLDEKADYFDCPKTYGSQNQLYWLSDSSWIENVSVPKTFSVDSCGEQHFTKPSVLGNISVSRGASLTADAPVTVNRVSCDLAEGGGTLSGLSFAASGVLEITGEAGRGESLDLGYDVSGCENAGNLSAWQVIVNGNPKPGYKIVVRGGKLGIVPPGMLIIVH